MAGCKVNLTQRLTEKSSCRLMDALADGLGAAAAVPYRNGLRCEIPAGHMAALFGVDAHTPALTLKHLVTRAVSHMGVCYEYRFINYKVVDWRYYPGRGVFGFTFLHPSAEEWHGTCGAFHLPFNRVRPGLADGDFFRILTCLAVDRWGSAVFDEWQEVEDPYEKVRFPATPDYIRQVRMRLNWSGFLRRMEKWMAETLVVCLEGQVSGRWQTRLFLKVEISEDRQVLWLTMSKRMLLAVDALVKEWNL